MEEQDRAPFSLNDYVAQLFEKTLYVVKNSRRRSILEAFNNHKIMSTKDIQQHLKEKGLLKNTRGYTKGRIRENHLILLIETRMLKEPEDNIFEITSFGRDIKGIISKVKEFDALPIPSHHELYPERALLELRDGKKTYSELKELDLPSSYQIMKRLREAGFIKISHPHGLFHASALSRFTVSYYHSFVHGLKAYVEKTGSSWFTEYSITPHLNRYWKERFDKSIDPEETRQLIEKGIGTGDIRKSKSQWKLYKLIRDPFRRLSSGRKILNLIEEGYDYVPMMAERSRLSLASIYKILERLKKRNLIEERKEQVTIELTEKGERLADCLFKIKKCVMHYIYTHEIDLEKRVEIGR
ncbi:MAG: MarR family winged helix-turn-helix transcriptional regulator, partial [Candidatus Bathyarchaeota archaeon]|nr:MarR family winged helix-turn-helix transcriptional regulator [Candidatus Bathyarchaeota archaeon]